MRLLENGCKMRLEDGTLAHSEEGELLRIDLHAEHAVTPVGEARRRDRSDVPESKDADSHLAMTPSSALTTVRAPRSQSKRSVDRRIAHRSHDCVNASRKPAASACGGPAGTKRPFAPCSTISGTPPTREATTGSPHAIASSATFGSPSLRLGMHRTSQAFIHFGMSRCNRAPTRRVRPFSLILADSRPAPTNTRSSYE